LFGLSRAAPFAADGFLLQALSPSAAMTVVAAGMAVTAIAATALAPVRDAGRRTPGAAEAAPAVG
jgi:hypothetical protein